MSRTRHFIHIKGSNLLYGRVPKVANSSIKSVLCRLLEQKPVRSIKTTSDRFWRECTHEQTELLTANQARKLRHSHYSFSFVRNPFDRLIAAYNNKVIEIDDPPLPMRRMGIVHNMPFDDFLGVLARASLEDYDVHLMPQHHILQSGERLVPKFIGRMEQMNDHWKILRKRMLRRGVRLAKALPEKNVRRSGGRSLTPYFNNARLIDQFLEIYGQDVKLFYSDVSIDTLIANASIPTIRPLKPSDANSDNENIHKANIHNANSHDALNP